MKKVLFLGLALLVFTANIFAKGQASLWGGYTTVCMKDVNNIFKLRKENAEKLIKEKKSFEIEKFVLKNLAYYKNFEVSKAKDAFIVGVDYLFGISKTVKIGPRVAFLQIKKVTEKISYSCPLLSGKKDESIDWSESVSLEARLVPIMFGGSYNINISKKFSLILKLFLGYGLINSKLSSSALKVESIPEHVLQEKGYDEQTFNQALRKNPEINEDLGTIGFLMSDISVGVQYLFTERFGLELGLGYRFMPETESKIKDREYMKFDFSGLTTKLSLSYKI